SSFLCYDETMQKKLELPTESFMLRDFAKYSEQRNNKQMDT
ncbi:929_t:CDS:1, partial [Scutellospora calospora]